MNAPRVHDESTAPLTAARFEVSGPVTASPRPAHPGFGPAAALLLLALATGGVVFVFFGLSPPPASDTATPAATEPATATVTVTASITASPEALALLAPEPPGARAAAQEALATLLPALEALRGRGMQGWDPAGLAALEAQVADGEKAYREQRYTAAQSLYADAQEAVAAAEARIPTVVAEALDAGERALLSADPRAAAQAFTRALALEPGNERAATGLRRAENYDRVVALLAEAKGYERMDDGARAEAAYREVLDLDPQAAEARQSLDRLARARADAAFTAAMSSGYKALERAEFAAAETAFGKALKLRPRATEAANALAQTRTRATAARIAAEMDAAVAAERREAWSDAAARFGAALAIDASLGAASDGRARAARRADLDRRLKATLAAPERLADPAVQAAAEKLLAEAGAVASPGPVLEDQRARLATQLTQARTPLPLELRSDGATEVTVLKIGALGRFTARTLSLPPGRYTAVGSREGFRDTRVEFTVTPAAPPPALTIQCVDPLPFGR